MNQKQMHQLLRQVADGQLSVEAAGLQLREEPFEDLGFAKVDHHRAIRQGAGEVIYGAGKTAEQIAGIVAALQRHACATILITRLKKETAACLRDLGLVLSYHEDCGIGIVGDLPVPDGYGKILIATGGTSDIPVAEEAALTAEALGNQVVRLYDVGVAGLHRLLAHTEDIMCARCIVAIAGME
ncbi:MAG: 1-(5-phosphoribosyl)-5-amino-4-imidazole-carboxylate carboxylase, partial [Oscillospiraceae bacterium]